MLTLLLMIFAQEKTFEVTLPFIKANKVNSENVVYTESCLQQIIRNFDNKPVYMVYYNSKGIETNLIKVGKASCCNMDELGWINARLDLNKPAPIDYVLRAHVRASKATTMPDKTYRVEEVEIVKFYLKPRDKAVKYN